MIEIELSSLKRLFKASSDQGLASALGIDRSTIAQWRRRGRLPPRYRSLAREFMALAEEEAAAVAALRQSIRSLVFRDPRYHYWIAAALAAIPADQLPKVEGEGAAERGKRLEALVADLLNRCLIFSREALGKVMPEDDSDYREIVAALAPASVQGGVLNDVLNDSGATG